MHGSSEQYVAGLYISDEMAGKFGLGRDALGGSSMNLVRGDRFEVVEPTVENDGEEPTGPRP